jgi:1-deoxy-D-xylulose-5-phosphate reductoisomerase
VNQSSTVTRGLGPIRVVILGSTGSIGVQALDIIRRNPDRFKVVALCATGANAHTLAQSALEFEVDAVGVSRGTYAQDVQMHLLAGVKDRGFAQGNHALPELVIGPSAPEDLAQLNVDVVLNAIAGAAGLRATLETLASGNRLALANKESLIIGGDLVKGLATEGQIIPVDSEHSAIAQCLLAGRRDEVRKLVITASGGPFLGKTREELEQVSVEQALAHPTWKMGPLVTVNSATLVNKGLEVIEAHLLFDVPFADIEVTVHPQSIVHSMVEFFDGSTIAQASPPDMRIPIAWGMSAGQEIFRVQDAAPACDWTRAAKWEFMPLDGEVFPAVGLARAAGEAGGTAPAVFNAANETAVAAFLSSEIMFTGIVEHIDRVLQAHLEGHSLEGNSLEGKSDFGPGSGFISGNALTLEDVLAADSWARGIVPGN